MRHRAKFRSLQYFCTFFCHNRSGHTLVASLLNAHPEVVISNEKDAVQIMRMGFNHGQIYWLIMRRDRNFAAHGSRTHHFSYHVPNQWQGRFMTLKIIGDKNGSCTIEHLQKCPDLYSRITRTFRIPVKVINVIRNPFDNIATLTTRLNQPLEQSIELYFGGHETIEQQRKLIQPSRWITVKNDEIIAHPKRELRRLCAFFDLEASESYLNDCAGIVYESPNKTRNKIEWTPELIRKVDLGIQRFPTLHGYSFDS